MTELIRYIDYLKEKRFVIGHISLDLTFESVNRSKTSFQKCYTRLIFIETNTKASVIKYKSK